MERFYIQISWTNSEESWRKERLDLFSALLHYRLPMRLLYKISKLHDQKGTLHVNCTPLLKSELDDIGHVVQQLWEHAFCEQKYIINLPNDDKNN